MQIPPFSISNSEGHEISLEGLTVQRKGIILEPNGQPWESKAVLNAAVIYVPEKETDNGITHIYYRAFGPDDARLESVPERKSAIGHATSIDGVIIDKRSEKPILQGEDPRITTVEGRHIMTYTDVDYSGPPGAWEAKPAIAETTNMHKFTELGEINISGLENVNKNVELFPEKVKGRYAAIAREKPNLFLVFSDDLIHWDSPQFIMGPRKGYWDSSFIGPAVPPIKTQYGWLNIYHGVDNDKVYRLGAALLDLNDPTKVLSKSKEPVLEPKEDYELGSIKGRPTIHNNVVYSCGATERGGELNIYYGGADQVIALATITMALLMKKMTTH